MKNPGLIRSSALFVSDSALPGHGGSHLHRFEDLIAQKVYFSKRKLVLFVHRKQKIGHLVSQALMYEEVSV